MSEIDDIFASKGKKPTTDKIDTPEPSVSKKKSKKSKKEHPDTKEKVSTDLPDTKEEKASTSKKRHLPETIVDPSQSIESSKRHKPAPPTTDKPKKSQKKEDEK